MPGEPWWRFVKPGSNSLHISHDISCHLMIPDEDSWLVMTSHWHFHGTSQGLYKYVLCGRGRNRNLLSPSSLRQCIMFHFIIRRTLVLLFLHFGLARFVVFSYPVRWHFTCFTKFICGYVGFVFLCLTVCYHILCIPLGLGSRTGTGCTDVVE